MVLLFINKEGLPNAKVLSDKSITPTLNVLQSLFSDNTYNCNANNPAIAEVLVIKLGIIFPAIIFILILSKFVIT